MTRTQPVIGISCELKSPDPRRSFSRKKEILVLNREYAQGVERAGGLPLPVPLLDNEELIFEFLGRLDGLILSGGSDVVAPNDNWRGDAACRKRSEFETILLLMAGQIKLPILGICRGLQQINVCYGGTLWPDLPPWKKGAIDHRRGKRQGSFRHGIIIDLKSSLAQVLGGTTIEVNSYHHQAALQVGKGLQAVAQAEDGVIEALEGDSEQVIWAVQWHPERLGDHPAGDGLLKQFMSLCSRRKLVAIS